MVPANVPDDDDQPIAANDNAGRDSPDPETLRKVNDVVRQLARLIGRQMAQEDFEAGIAAAVNDNMPTPRGVPDDEAAT
jgi:hypothetical protein